MTHSLSPNDALAMYARITLDGVEQTDCTYASEHAGYVRRLVRRNGHFVAEGDHPLEETVAGDVVIDFPRLTPEQVERLESYHQ